MAVKDAESTTAEKAATEYNSMAAEYCDLKHDLPAHKYSELPSFLNLVGYVGGLRVLDMATGGGKYSRIYKDAGAAQVVGVDISSEMIKLAKSQRSDIEYYVADCTKMDELNLGKFDVISASFLLNYATSEHMLQEMIRNVKLSLVPNGRFVTLNINPFFMPNDYHYTEKYGYEMKVSCRTSKPPNGTAIDFKITNHGRCVEFTNYHMDGLLIKKLFEESGFTFRYIETMVDDNGAMPNGFWDDWKSHTPVIMMEAILNQ
eukprot:NODE_518_length_7331_cov_0.450913.p3 type:complete len:260 gc:universal NODE_518_length_7331_cov_0.450913:6752-5973(-)